jgi:hypothetical protein
MFRVFTKVTNIILSSSHVFFTLTHVPPPAVPSQCLQLARGGRAGGQEHHGQVKLPLGGEYCQQVQEQR